MSINNNGPLGATGAFPQGKLNAEDEGELCLAVEEWDGNVAITFGKSVEWLAMDPDGARALANVLRNHAASIQLRQVIQRQLAALAELNLRDVIIAVDFDGTCVTHEFPKVGREVPYATDVLKALAAAGAQLIVWTIRSDQEEVFGDPHAEARAEQPEDEQTLAYLKAACDWFAEREIPLCGINTNEQQKTWSSSPKAYAHVYIDDAAIGCPLINTLTRPYVDWPKILDLLLERFEIKEAANDPR